MISWPHHVGQHPSPHTSIRIYIYKLVRRYDFWSRDKNVEIGGHLGLEQKVSAVKIFIKRLVHSWAGGTDPAGNAAKGRK